MLREAIAFLFGTHLSDRLVHHLLRDSPECQEDVSMFPRCSLICQVPKAEGKVALEEEMHPEFLYSFAKAAKTTIWPTSLGQPIGGPNPILDSQPSKKLDLGRGTSLPNRLLYRRVESSYVLRQISGSRQV